MIFTLIFFTTGNHQHRTQMKKLVQMICVKEEDLMKALGSCCHHLRHHLRSPRIYWKAQLGKPTFFKIFGDFGILLKRQFAIVKPFINRFPKFFLYCVQIDHYIGINFMILRCWKNDICRHFMIFGVFFAIFLFLPYYDQGWKKYFSHAPM